MTNLKEKLPLFLFVFSICFFIYIFGGVSGDLNLFPYSEFKLGYKQLFKIIKKDTLHHLLPIRFEESGVTVLKREKMMPGVTLLTTYWNKGKEWSPGARLIDEEGKTLHHWEINPEKIWPQSPHDDHVRNHLNREDNYIHGSYVFPNGDLIFNIEYLGLTRVDSTGKMLWKLPYRTHHSVFCDEDGNFWVSGLKWVEKGSKRSEDFTSFKTPFSEETVLKVSPDGKILKEISLLEIIYNSEYKHLFWHYGRITGDLLHLNDVEILSSELENGFTLFEAGDIVVSSRYLHFIAVISQEGKLKWLSPGIFTMQHDPDYEENGWIVVFDNRVGLKESMIRAIKPATNEVRNLYSANGDKDFYTFSGGKHQKLDNGNRLITESNSGRVFEITPDGEIVWEWINYPFNEKRVPEVLEGTRYAISKNEIAAWDK